MDVERERLASRQTDWVNPAWRMLPTAPQLLALRVVVVLALARTALAARRSVPAYTTALAPD